MHIPTNHCTTTTTTTTHRARTPAHAAWRLLSLEIGCVSQPKIFTVAKKLNIFAQKGAADQQQQQRRRQQRRRWGKGRGGGSDSKSASGLEWKATTGRIRRTRRKAAWTLDDQASVHECVCVCVCEPMLLLLLLNLKFKMPATLYSFPARRNRRRARERDRVQVEGGCGQRVQGGRPSMSCCWTLAKNALAVSRCRPRSCQSRRHKFWAQPASPRLPGKWNESARARVRTSKGVCVCVPDPGPDAGKEPTGRTLAGHQMQKACRCWWKWR